MKSGKATNDDWRSVSIVIPSYNGKELLKRFLPSVVAAAEHYPGDTEIILVDDGSSDGSGKYITSEFPQIKLVSLGENRGFADACNRGFAAGKKEIVILLNNDMEVARDFIGPLIKHFDDKDIFAVRPGLRMLWAREVDLTNFLLGLSFKRGLINLPMLRLKKRPSPFYCAAASGGAAAFDRKKLEYLKGFDLLFLPFYWEDTDISYRAWKRGWKIIFEPESAVYHKSHATIGNVYQQRYTRMVAERNRYLFFWKNISDWRMMFIHILFVPLRLSVSLVTGNWWRLRAFFKALKRLLQVRRRRKVEKRECCISDRGIFSLFSNIMRGAEPFFRKET